MTLVWTTTSPARPGWWFVRHPDDNWPWVTWVFRPPKIDRLYYRDDAGPADVVPVADAPPGTLWAGPIPEPADPPAEVPS